MEKIILVFISAVSTVAGYIFLKAIGGFEWNILTFTAFLFMAVLLWIFTIGVFID